MTTKIPLREISQIEVAILKATESYGDGFDYNNPETELMGNGDLMMRFSPNTSVNWQHQEEAGVILDDLVNDRFTHDIDGTDTKFNKLIINIPTGGGKTRIFLEHIKRWYGKFKIIVIVAPGVLLLRQLESETKKMMGAAKLELEYHMVSSDKNDYYSDDDIDMDSDLYQTDQNPSYASCAEDEIEKRMRERVNPLIIFSTCKSLERVGSVAKKLDIEIDMLICDEGHRMCDKTAAMNLDYNNFPVKYTAFFTATVREKISNTDIPLEHPMSNLDEFGPVAFKVLPRTLIERNVILAPQHLVISWNDKSRQRIEKMIEARNIKMEEDIKNEFILFICGLIAVFNRTRKIKTIVYAQSIKVAEWYKKQMPVIIEIISTVFDEENLDIYSTVVTGRISGSERIQQFEDFKKAEHGILFNYAVIKEGIDIKDCNSIALLRILDSVGLMQAIGRALRVDPNDPNKRFGYIICPINTDGKQKGDAIQRMTDVATILFEEGYKDTIVNELNNADRLQGDGSKDSRYKDLNDIDWTNLTNSEIYNELKNASIEGELLSETEKDMFNSLD